MVHLMDSEGLAEQQHKCRLLRDSISNLPKVFPDSSWHQRLIRRVQKLFLVSINHPEVFLFLKSNAAVEKESKRQVTQFSDFIIHPLSDFRNIFNIFIFVVMFLRQMLTAFAIGFIVEIEDNLDACMILDFIFCAILFVETLLRFRTGFIVKETNEIILDANTIAKKYRKKFATDILFCVPSIFIASQITEIQQGTVNGSIVVFMIVLFLFSFYRFNRILFYFSSVPIILKLTETETILLTLCLRTIYW